MMKTSIALSGCDMGGISSYHVLRVFERMGFDITMLSASGIPAMGALCFACGISPPEYEAMAESFLEASAREDMDTALADFAAEVNLRRIIPKRSAAISAAEVAGERAVVFTNAFSHLAGNLVTYPLEDSYDVLSAAVSPCRGLAAYYYRSEKLCDYSVRYGLPVFPLKLLGNKRVIGVSFSPEKPLSPYETLLSKNIEKSAPATDLYIDMAFPGKDASLDEYNKIATDILNNCKELAELAKMH